MRIRRAPIGTVATIYVAAGYNSLDIERQFRGVRSPNSLAPTVNPRTETRSSHRENTSKMELLDDVHRLAQPAAIDLVSDDSGAENDLLASDTNQLRGVQNQAAAPEEDGTDFGNLGKK